MKSTLIFLLSILTLFALDYTNLSSDFTQEVKAANKRLKYTGKFVISTQKAFWSYESPVKKSIYIDKDRVVIIEPALEQVIITKLNKMPNLNEIMKRAKYISKDKMQASFDGVLYELSFENSLLKKIFYKDEFENEVTITLKNTKKNQKLDPFIFSVFIPKGYDVIK